MDSCVCFFLCVFNNYLVRFPKLNSTAAIASENSVKFRTIFLIIEALSMPINLLIKSMTKYISKMCSLCNYTKQININLAH